jgi:hypothetical protein
MKLCYLLLSHITTFTGKICGYFLYDDLCLIEMYMVHSIMHINTKTCDFMNNQSLLFVKLIMDLEMACICIQIMRNENSCDSIIFFFLQISQVPLAMWLMESLLL